jgi:hypothetical protein
MADRCADRSIRGRRLGRQSRAIASSLGVFVVVACFASGTAAAAPGAGRLEENLSKNGSKWAIGEPQIAVDPTNPKRLFLGWTTFPVPLDIGASTAGIEACGGLVSTNAGRTWKKVHPPYNHIPDTLGCGDVVAAAGPDGTLYAGGITPTYTAVAEGGITVGGLGIIVHGRDVVSRSSDWGQTWSKPVVTVSSDAARTVGGSPVDTLDRPWLAVDQSDGTVYASGRNLVAGEGIGGERFITASTDKARSFGPVFPIDSPEYHQAGSATIAAAHGAVAVSYTAESAPDATCPCVIFETSEDHGKSFDRHVVPLVGATDEPNPFLTADPSTKGRFAITVFDAAGTGLQVYVTDDSGATWKGPVAVGEDPPNTRFKPWLSYGPSGQLDLVWRTQYGDGSYDVWAAVGRHDDQDGVRFSAPLKVSTQAAPYPDGYYGGDDFSYIIGDDQYVHVGWGDSRNGPTQAWYGRISRDAFHSS